MEIINVQTLPLNPVIAEKFQTYMKYEPVINSLIDSGIFDTKNGHVTMDFNHRGHVLDVKISIETKISGLLT